ncbi:MAG: DEAD/DEAH box helicase [Nitrospirota bacterium]
MKHDTTHPPTTPLAKGFSPGFAALGLEAGLLTTLEALGYEEPTAIQREAIPPMLAGKDLLGQAATGTGKTAAFTLPLLQRVARAARRQPAALILVPTRELAMQVTEAVQRYGKELRLTVLAIYGGQSMGLQLQALRRGVEIVVATPGRALDHIRRNTLQLKHLQIVVLDEADEMLDMGFAEDLDAILEQTPADRQTALFSATMPSRIAAIARRHLKNPVEIRIAREPVKAGAAPRVRQTAYLVTRPHKVTALGRILDMTSPTSALVFCRTRLEVDELTGTLKSRGYRAEALHGGLNQAQRDRVMQSFRSGQTRLLVATDVAARGLDIPHVSHVVNFDVPSAPEVYVHRIGRTGRAGREGAAVTIVEPREQRLLRNIEQLTKSRIEVAPVPTVADLHAKRLTATRASIQEVLAAGDLDLFRAVVESLAEQGDAMAVAAAAVKWAYQSRGEERKEEEIPTLQTRGDETRRVPPRYAPDSREPARGSKAGDRPDRSSQHSPSAARVTLHIGAGKTAGVRPGDLVGAIVNETGLHARLIGAIEVTDRYSLVEVPKNMAGGIIEALSRTKIRGQKVPVRIVLE